VTLLKKSLCVVRNGGMVGIGTGGFVGPASKGCDGGEGGEGERIRVSQTPLGGIKGASLRKGKGMEIYLFYIH